MAVSVKEGIEREMYETMDLEAARRKMVESEKLGKVVLSTNLTDGDKNEFNNEFSDIYLTAKSIDIFKFENVFLFIWILKLQSNN